MQEPLFGIAVVAPTIDGLPAALAAQMQKCDFDKVALALVSSCWRWLLFIQYNILCLAHIQFFSAGGELGLRVGRILTAIILTTLASC